MIVGKLFGHQDKTHTLIEQTISELQRDDRELDRRLRILRDQVDVYQRTTRREDSSAC